MKLKTTGGWMAMLVSDHLLLDCFLTVAVLGSLFQLRIFLLSEDFCLSLCVLLLKCVDRS